MLRYSEDERFQVGRPFGRYTVASEVFYERRNGSSVAVCWCDCACGNRRKVLCSKLVSGTSNSCGCNRSIFNSERNRKHCFSGTAIYRRWLDIIKRCENPKSTVYAYYGGRGIRMCPEWRASFEAFFDWAMANGYQHGLTIDRYPNKDGDYEPGNCRWTDMQTQCNNKRNNTLWTAFGETKTVAEWSRDSRCLVSVNCLHRRHAKGIPAEQAITEPSTPGKSWRKRTAV